MALCHPRPVILLLHGTSRYPRTVGSLYPPLGKALCIVRSVCGWMERIVAILWWQRSKVPRTRGLSSLMRRRVYKPWQYALRFGRGVIFWIATGGIWTRRCTPALNWCPRKIVFGGSRSVSHAKAWQCSWRDYHKQVDPHWHRVSAISRMGCVAQRLLHKGRDCSPRYHCQRPTTLLLARKSRARFLWPNLVLSHSRFNDPSVRKDVSGSQRCKRGCTTKEKSPSFLLYCRWVPSLRIQIDWNLLNKPIFPSPDFLLKSIFSVEPGLALG